MINIYTNENAFIYKYRDKQLYLQSNIKRIAVTKTIVCIKLRSVEKPKWQ